MVTRALLGLEPDLMAGTVRLNPCLGDWMVDIRRLGLGDRTVSLVARGTTVVSAATDGLDLLVGTEHTLANTAWGRCPTL
jgi:hypothetical protein